MPQIVGRKMVGKYELITFDWTVTPRWLRLLGFKPMRQYTMLIPDPHGPGGWWRYSADAVSKRRA
jgi:hypothetical protein